MEVQLTRTAVPNVVRNTKRTSLVARLVRLGRPAEARGSGARLRKLKPPGALPGPAAERRRSQALTSGRGSAIEGTVPRRCIGAAGRPLEPAGGAAAGNPPVGRPNWR